MFASLGAAAGGAPPDDTPSKPERGRPLSGSSTVIGTLDPMKLTSKDYLASVSWATRGSSASNFHLNVNQYHDGRPRVSLVQPTSQRDLDHLQSKIGGFLYYHQPPRAPPLAGELRFRLTASRDPASFSSGVDMTNRREVPWCIPLPAIAGNQTFASVRHILTAVDATVPQQLMDLARKHYHKFLSGNLMGTRHLRAFGQPFDIPLDRGKITFAVVGKDRVAYARLKNISSFHTGRRPGDSEPLERHFPVSGTVICCFEPSSLPEHSGKRVVVLRVLRSLEWDPIRPNPTYTGPPIPPELYPQAGQLLMTFRYRKPLVWALDVDRSGWKRSNTAAPFALLFENALEYGSSACDGVPRPTA